jgi:hypothetical protein
MLELQERRSWHDIVMLGESWFYLDTDHEPIWAQPDAEIREKERHTVQKVILTIVWSPGGFRLVNVLPKVFKFNASDRQELLRIGEGAGVNIRGAVGIGSENQQRRETSDDVEKRNCLKKQSMIGQRQKHDVATLIEEIDNKEPRRGVLIRVEDSIRTRSRGTRKSSRPRCIAKLTFLNRPPEVYGDDRSLVAR